MLRHVLPVLLLAGCLDDVSLPAFEGQATTPQLRVTAEVQYTRCEGAPCSEIKVGVRLDDGWLAGTFVDIRADHGAAVRAAFVPDAVAEHSGTHQLVASGWIEQLRIDATAGDDTAQLTAQSAITTPDEAGVRLPGKIVLGSTATLRWNGQGVPYQYALVYATQVPALRFGFLESFAADDGEYRFGKSLFTAAGEYTIAMYRSIDYQSIGDDDQLSLWWGSNWQTKVVAADASQL